MPMQKQRDSSPGLRRAILESDRLRELPPSDPRNPDDDTAIVAALADCLSALERNLNGVPSDGPRHAALDSVRVHLGRFAAITAEHEIPPERVVVMLKRGLRNVTAIQKWIDSDRDKFALELEDIAIAAYFGQDGFRKRDRQP